MAIKPVIIYEDDDLVVVNKQPGELTIPERFKKDNLSLRERLDELYGKIFVVHRLDRETSGAILFAKNADVHKHLNQQFMDHSVTKIYHVLVAGVVGEESFEVDIPIAPNPKIGGTMMPSARGKEAITLMRIAEKFRHVTLLECKLLTGRQHQIRVHCAAIGHPLLVDNIYGNSDAFLLSAIKRRYKLKKETTEVPLISRLTLHSRYLKFVHPVKNTEIEITADYPRDFQAVLQVLRKYSSI